MLVLVYDGKKVTLAGVLGLVRVVILFWLQLTMMVVTMEVTSSAWYGVVGPRSGWVVRVSGQGWRGGPEVWLGGEGVRSGVRVLGVLQVRGKGVGALQVRVAWWA
jgi:hypothetical protein